MTTPGDIAPKLRAHDIMDYGNRLYKAITKVNRVSVCELFGRIRNKHQDKFFEHTYTKKRNLMWETRNSFLNISNF